MTQLGGQAADWLRMRARMLRMLQGRRGKGTVCIAAAALVLSACGSNTIGRDEAIGVLQTTGISEAEATCVADSLLVLDALDAADPRRELTDQGRTALVNATSRCVGAGADPVAEVAGALEFRSGAAPNPAALAASVNEEFESNLEVEGLSEEELAELGLTLTEQDVVELRELAVAKLVSFGRSEESARCIIDRLRDAGADFVLAEDSFGLGLSPFEAEAFAACS